MVPSTMVVVNDGVVAVVVGMWDDDVDSVILVVDVAFGFLAVDTIVDGNKRNECRCGVLCCVALFVVVVSIVCASSL